ncbi:hypothetical protein [Chryseobacterium echinoideorum]|uniref:hypothetical protein n=1 Tax=Chryseobacterium echinoideorum TaxID=1549648 RepID=UPI0011851DEC|nr:hypothetical protein [Chryseobacterium echinoideorum]
MTEEKRRGSSVPLIIGMLGAGAGIIMKIAGHSQMNKAVRAYRYSDSKKFVPVYYVLNDQNGVGVLMKF